MNINQQQNQNYYFLVKITPIIFNTSIISQKPCLKKYKICIFKGADRISEQKFQRNLSNQMLINKNNDVGCYFSLLNYSHRRPVQLVVKFVQECSPKTQKVIFYHKLYSYELVNNFLTKNQKTVKETIKTGFETEFLIQCYIQYSKAKLQQLAQSQKQNQYSIRVNQQAASQTICQGLNLKKDLSLLMPEQAKHYLSKSQCSTPTAMYKLGLFQSFADQKISPQFYKGNRPRFFSSTKSSDQGCQFTDKNNNSSLIAKKAQYNNTQKLVHIISTQMDNHIGYHIQNQIQTRSNRSKFSISLSKKSSNTIIRSFKTNKSYSKTSESTVQSPQMPQIKDQGQYSKDSSIESQLQENWQSQRQTIKINFLAFILVLICLLYFLLSDGGQQIYRKKKVKKSKTKNQYENHHL